MRSKRSSGTQLEQSWTSVLYSHEFFLTALLHVLYFAPLPPPSPRPYQSKLNLNYYRGSIYDILMKKS